MSSSIFGSKVDAVGSSSATTEPSVAASSAPAEAADKQPAKEADAGKGTVAVKPKKSGRGFMPPMLSMAQQQVTTAL